MSTHGRHREDRMDPRESHDETDGIDELAPLSESGEGEGLRGGKCCHADPLLTWTIFGVFAGVVMGIVMNMLLPADARDETRQSVVHIIGFPGKAFLNLLKMMVLPLIAGSMIAGVCSLQQTGAQTGRLARLALTYFAGTTTAAVVLGLFLVVTIRPGAGGAEWMKPDDDEDEIQTTDKSMVETILDIFLKLFPSNIVEAAATMNVLGVVTFSLFFGTILSRIGPAGETLINGIHVFNEVIMNMVLAILWLSPVGISCLIASQMNESADLANTAKSLALYAFTVCLGLVIQGFAILPAVYFFCTRKSPWVFIGGMRQAIVTAFGTDSSSATLPVTMMCVEKMGISPNIAKFVLPLGATVNMNGTALYEALTVIFIAQLHGVTMTGGHLFLVAFTSCLAAVGAAAIPSAGLVTMVMVLQAVGLDRYAGDLSMVFAIDWALDRVRTVVNVLSDAFGAAIVQHMSPMPPPTPHTPGVEMRGLVRGGARGGSPDGAAGAGMDLERGDGAEGRKADNESSVVPPMASN